MPLHPITPKMSCQPLRIAHDRDMRASLLFLVLLAACVSPSHDASPDASPAVLVDSCTISDAELTWLQIDASPPPIPVWLYRRSQRSSSQLVISAPADEQLPPLILSLAPDPEVLMHAAADVRLYCAGSFIELWYSDGGHWIANPIRPVESP